MQNDNMQLQCRPTIWLQVQSVLTELRAHRVCVLWNSSYCMVSIVYWSRIRLRREYMSLTRRCSQWAIMMAHSCWIGKEMVSEYKYPRVLFVVPVTFLSRSFRSYWKFWVPKEYWTCQCCICHISIKQAHQASTDRDSTLCNSWQTATRSITNVCKSSMQWPTKRALQVWASGRRNVSR